MGAFGALTGAYSYGPNMITSVIHSFLSFIVDLLCLDTNLDTRNKIWILFRYFWSPSQIPGNFWGYGHCSKFTLPALSSVETLCSGIIDWTNPQKLGRVASSTDSPVVDAAAKDAGRPAVPTVLKPLVDGDWFNAQKPPCCDSRASLSNDLDGGLLWVEIVYNQRT